jgi:DNA anti-recombination protein RmuC
VTPKHELSPANPARVSGEDAGGAGVPDTAGGASLDKVRDILFGVQVRDFERRFARLEERLAKETSDLKDDLKKRLEAVEQYARQEAASLGDQVRAEHAARADAERDLARELQDATKALERRIAAVDEQLIKSQREFRQQMLEQYQRLTDDIRQKVDEVLAALARETGDLRTDKVDRAMLASLLNEMAMRLGNELTLPDVEELGND